MAWDDVLVAHVSKYTAAIHNEMVNQIKARILHSLDTEANGVLVGTGAGAFIFKTLAQFKVILGLGDAAYKNTGSSTGTLCAGDDSRLSNTRDPNAHTHVEGDITNLTTDLAGKVATSDIDIDATFAANSDTKVPSQKAVKAAISGITPPYECRLQPTILTTSVGVRKSMIMSTTNAIQQSAAENGDIFSVPFFSDGSETILDITCVRTTTTSIFDIYINDILDSSGYDTYATSTGNVYFFITLSNSPPAGKGVLKLVVNGKNTSSSGHTLAIRGVFLR